MIFKNQKISVIMACYNRPDFLKISIESILNQTYSNFELIIVDDCSNKKTSKLKRVNEVIKISWLESGCH